MTPATACLALLIGYICVSDPMFDRGPVAPRAAFFTCAEPKDRAAAMRLPECSAVGEPEEWP